MATPINHRRTSNMHLDGEQRLVYSEAPNSSSERVIATADDAELVEEDAPGKLTRMTRWFGRRLRAAINFPKYVIREVPNVAENGVDAVGTIINWARGNVKAAADVGLAALWRTPKNIIKEAARIGIDPIRGVMTNTRDSFRQLFKDDYTLSNMLWRFPKNALFASISPITGYAKGVKNYLAGSSGTDDANVLRRWKDVMWDRDGGGVKAIWNQTGKLIRQTAITGPIGTVRKETEIFAETSDSIRTVLGRVVDTIPLLGTESIADALIPRGRELNQLLRSQQSPLESDNQNSGPSSAQDRSPRVVNNPQTIRTTQTPPPEAMAA